MLKNSISYIFLLSYNVAFVTEQDDVGDGVVEHWTILDSAGPWVTMVQLLHGHLKERVV